ncbi:uncharacterized protein LOC106156392 [Lingula anatina]|uniref:Uncharacterized protein LOC106156392 n=1 Tax=Lingula anatina TaxID=7574 RepID=A0A1S3HNH1_LINAN|nr:uncharacterized protein LOC106156392 [Lingula anatina]|eukprot:XP_013387071.1 uncharacterized protein LOC106156392 [Lingula anatina]
MSGVMLEPQMTYDFNIIFDEDNNESFVFGRNVMEKLEARGLRGFFYPRNNLPGNAIADERIFGVDNSMYNIVIVDPSSNDSGWARWSRLQCISSLLDMKGTGNIRRLIPIAVVKCPVPQELRIHKILRFDSQDDEEALTKLEQVITRTSGDTHRKIGCESTEYSSYEPPDSINSQWTDNEQQASWPVLHYVSPVIMGIACVYLVATVFKERLAP